MKTVDDSYKEKEVSLEHSVNTLDQYAGGLLFPRV